VRRVRFDKKGVWSSNLWGMVELKHRFVLHPQHIECYSRLGSIFFFFFLNCLDPFESNFKFQIGR
jgi:hypothetical protein